MKRYLLFILLLSFFFCPNSSNAIGLNLDYPEFGGFDINREDQQDLSQIVAWFYYFVVGISGLAAFVMLVVGGFRWLVSAGNPTAVSDAKDQITKALLGLLLILMSWLVLQVINPDLIILTNPILPGY